MKFWEKKQANDAVYVGVSAAVTSGASPHEWIRQAVHRISMLTEADRVGVWLDAEVPLEGLAYGLFRGSVWDRDNPETPPEWCQLSTEAPLPGNVLSAKGSASMDLGASRDSALLGPLLELRHALWVPIPVQGQLRGIILVGSKARAFVLSAVPVEGIAAELALALERSQFQWSAQNYRADLEVTRAVLQAVGNDVTPEATLRSLVRSSLEILKSPELGSGAAVAIGACEPFATLEQPSASTSSHVAFSWTEGDANSLATLQTGPASEAWRAALETRRTVGVDLRHPGSQGSAGRALAIPLIAHGKLLGLLVAALPSALASLATLERLELRACLAAAALARKQADENRSRREAASREAITASQHALLLLDASGNILEWSAPVQDLLTRSAGPSTWLSPERSSCPFSALLRTSDRSRASAWLLHEQEALNTRAGSNDIGEPLEAESEGGSPLRIHYLGPAGEAASIVLLEPLQAPAAAQQSAETELRNVIEWLEEGVILFDARENVRAINLRFEQMAGLSPEESGKFVTLATLIARLEGQSADPLAFAERWRSLARGIDSGVREELQMLHPVPRVLERSARPILDNVGRLVGRVEIYRDLTAQRVFQSKLLQTEKLAALGQMLTGVAHELSNPLTTILGYAQRLLTRKDTAGQSEEARQIHQEAERATRILRQLLSHARETPPERRTLSLNQVVSRTMELRRFGLAAEKISVEMDLDPVLPQVRGDAGQLQQVLMNLLGNAQQAIEQQGRGGTIRIRTRSEQGQVFLTVEDTGPGIPQAILARVFDPFFTTKPAGVGTGLGLSIVLSIAREHGGQVRVSSPPGKGASFAVELPAVALRSLPSIDPDTREHHLRTSDSSRPSADAIAIRAARAAGVDAKRILVVEDEPTVARFISDVLEEEGCEVQVLLDGREALDRVCRESFDLVICDMKMPGLDGQQFYKSLKRMGHGLANNFLFVTGDTIGPAIHGFLTQNHLPHLSKPFRLEELTEHVWRALRDPSRLTHAPVASRRRAARNG